MMVAGILFLAGLLAGTSAFPQSPGHFREGKVVGGTNATEGEFPFHINFEMYFFNSWYFLCAGVLIDDRRIVTSAAAILSVPFEIRAIAGDYILYNASANDQVRSIAARVIHDGYEPSTRNNDLAILTVDTPFILNQFVQPLRLAETAFGDPEGEVVSIGFGDIDNMPGPMLLKATMNVIDRETCDASYDDYDEDYDYLIPPLTEAMVCAGAPGKEICGSDRGGALIAKDVAGRDYLAGLASWGPNECEGYPSVFTNISPLRGWIDSQLNP